MDDFSPEFGADPCISKDLSYEECVKSVRAYLSSLKADSSPGFPWRHAVQTNASLLENPSLVGDVVHIAAVRLYLLQKLTPEQLIHVARFIGLLDDPSWVFVKGEPHTRTKAQEGRWRLIHAVSAPDQLVERVVLGPTADALLGAFPQYQATYGLGFTADLASRLSASIRSYMDSNPGGDLFSMDVKGWDATVSPKLLIAGWLWISRKTTPEHRKLGLAVVFLLSRKRWFIPASGEIVAREQRAFMPSGSYFTTILNSAARILVARVAGARYAWAQGDDSLEVWPKGTTFASMRDAYGALGVVLKVGEPCTPERFEFCSHLFVPSSGQPAELLSWQRGLFAILSTPQREWPAEAYSNASQTPESQALAARLASADGYFTELAHNPNAPLVGRILDQFFGFGRDGREPRYSPLEHSQTGESVTVRTEGVTVETVVQESSSAKRRRRRNPVKAPEA
jgi:hypothetical protein